VISLRLVLEILETLIPSLQKVSLRIRTRLFCLLQNVRVELLEESGKS